MKDLACKIPWKTFFLGIIVSFLSLGYLQAQVELSGTVSDDSGEPLIGVNILLKGTSTGTVTDIDGTFSLTVAPDAILVFSYTGFASQEIPVNGRNQIDVRLISDVSLLDEVVVIGYGTQRRGSVTGAISSIKAEDIQELPVTDAGQALQGRAAGVVALASGNRPGQGVTIRIRGRRSLTATNEPLFVVDGIPYDGNISDINPKDISSMEILKDASATAIYGSRGANGVILITTNRGGDFPTTVSYSGYYGITSVIGVPDMMNGEQYYRLKEVGGRAFTADETAAHNDGISTNWTDLVLDNGHQQNHQVSVRGGSSKTGFAISANYFNEGGVIETQNYDRYTFRVNLDHQATNRLKVGTSTQISNSKQDWATNTYGGALNISPLAEPYDAEDNLIYRPGADPLLWNPLADYVDGNFEDERRTLRVFSNIFAELDIIKGLKYRLNFGPDYREYRRGVFEGTNSSSRQGGDPRVQKEHERVYNYTLENILTYSLASGDHDLTATGLFSVQESKYEYTNIQAENIPYETQLYHNIGTAETVLGFGSELSEWGIMSFMGRLNYEYLGKYMVTLTGRYDGSSRLAEGNKWGFFPSAAVLWRVSNENFMEDMSGISNLRLRLSYGVTGNTGIDPYQTRGSLSRTIYSFGGNAAFGYRPGALANPELQWESSATANIGIDFGFWDHRITGSFELYRTNTTDLLLERQIPITSGFNAVFENIGETLNRGWELSLVTRNIATGDFSWETTLNVFGNKEEIVDLYGTKQDDVGNQWFIGEPLTVWYDYEKLGIWQTSEADAASVYGLIPGQIKVRDVNNDNIINQDDRVILGTDIPTVTLGLGSRFEYKGFDLSFLLLGVFGHTVENNFETGQATLQGRYNNLNVDYWTESNPTNDHPKPDGSVERPLYHSSRAYYPGDFFKIKNIQIGYNIVGNDLSRVGIKRARVYLNMDTPHFWQRLPQKYLDPEVYGGEVTGDVPTTRMFSFGLMADF
jgi:TonB-linked SusC/RagA family outer membrane protein